MSAPLGGGDADPVAQEVADLIPMVRRIVVARVGTHPSAEDLVQETLTRVLAAADSVEPGMLEPYAVATARNVVASVWRTEDRARRNQHRVVDLTEPDSPEASLLTGEEQAAMTRALASLDEGERRLLLDHEVAGADTKTMAEDAGSTAGAIAARLNRTRARLRVEYLLELDRAATPTAQCRPVLLALSGGDARRQREVGAAQHLLECDLCARLSEPLLQRGQHRDDIVRIGVERDADIVRARGAARQVAARLDLGATDLTLVATAVSEVCRNIVRFASRGEVVIELLDVPRRGLRVTARDAGPGIPDVEQALQDGFSTYGGLGLGLPGIRRLMDDFVIVSEPDHGTTVTMTKWERTNDG
ncbi:MAG: sigma-70 family RNA polymerase sigma factor [Actinomycetes bacterium]